MRYAVLGAAGQLGRDLCPRLEGDVVPLTRQQADLTRPADVRTALTQLRPDVVVNCAAYNFVDRAESEVQEALAVNAVGVQHLAEVCRDLDCTLVHFSTDYVFGAASDPPGKRRQPYTEDDRPEPVNHYGTSKLRGEEMVQSIAPRHFVVRTCGLYGVWGSGGKGGNFVETMLRVAREGKPLRVVADQECTPSYTVDVAQATAALIATGRCGLYHLTNAGSCSWYEFAQAIFALAEVEADLTPIPSAEWKAAARRPAYSVLACGKAEAAGVPSLRTWREALAAYLQERRY